MSSSKLFDEQKFSLEISTRSMEQTLTPLVNQITTLVNYRERPIKSEKTRQLIAQLSRALQSAIERFVSVGEKIALEHAEIKYEMLDVCVRVRQAGAEICRHGSTTGQCSSPSQTELELRNNDTDGGNESPTRWSRSDAEADTVSALCQKLTALNSGNTSTAAPRTSASSRPQSTSGEALLAGGKTQSVTMSDRQLLSAICRVLLLADRVVIKQLVAAIDKVAASLARLERCNSAVEFSREFATFGDSMVNLGYLSGDRQNDLKDDVQRVQMSAARSVLEKSTTILLASAKTCLRLSDSDAARRARDCVLAHMRSALSRLEKVVTQGNGNGNGNGNSNGNASSSSNGSSADKDKENNKDKGSSASPNAAGLQSPPASAADSTALGSGDSGIVLQNATSSSNSCAFKSARELQRTLEQLAALICMQAPAPNPAARNSMAGTNGASGSQQLLHFHEMAARCSELRQTLHLHNDALQDALSDFAESPFVSVSRRSELQAASSKLTEQVAAADAAVRSPVDYLHAVGATRMMNVLDAVTSDDELAELARRAEASCLTAAELLRSSVMRLAFDCAIEQVCEALKVEKDTQTLLAVKLCAANGDTAQLGDFLGRFDERTERLSELAKTLRHVAAHDVLVVATEHTFGVLQTLARLVALAADTLVRHGSAKQAKEQLDAVCDAYQQQLLDVANLVKDINDAQHARWSLDVARLTFLKQLTRTHSVLSLQRASAGSRTATQSPNASSCYLNAAAHASQPNVATMHSGTLSGALRQQAVLDRSMPRSPRSRSHRASPQLSLVDISEPFGDVAFPMGPPLTAPLTPQLLILSAISRNAQLLAKVRVLDELAQPVLQFAVSRGPIRTTHELFVHCSRFCDELTQFNRALRAALTALASQLAGMQLSASADAHYQLLLFETDRLSALGQQFITTLRVQTAGRSQTFQKVDSLIQLVRAVVHCVHSKILVDPVGPYDPNALAYQSAGSLQPVSVSLGPALPHPHAHASSYHPPHRSSGVVSDDEVAYGEYDDDYPAHARMNLRAYAHSGNSNPYATTTRVSTSSQTPPSTNKPNTNTNTSSRPPSAQSQPNPQRLRSAPQEQDDSAVQTQTQTQTQSGAKRVVARASSEDQSSTSNSTASTNSGATVRQQAAAAASLQMHNALTKDASGAESPKGSHVTDKV